MGRLPWIQRDSLPHHRRRLDSRQDEGAGELN